MMESFVDNEW